ncbi:MAG: FecR family protein [Polyangiaceae bacterium]
MTKASLEKELALARRAAPTFGLARQQSVIWGVRRRLRPAPLASHRLLFAAAACIVGLVVGGFVWSTRSTDGAATARVAADERWQLRDGSRIVLETPDTRITKQRESSEEVSFELAAGAARFDVVRKPERAFRVRAGAVSVEVVGTLFRVERQGERTLVSVERGRVRVSWASAMRELSAGQQGLFPPSEQATAASEPTASSAAAAPLSGKREGAALRSTEASAAAPAAVNTPTAEALFVAADRARAEGRHQDAAKTLRQLTQTFPRDPRAPLAAFTLGRLLLQNLRQPADAARAFAQARALAGSSTALAEDALAREVEAWGAAGNTAEAAKRAELYRTLYPRGARLKQVQRATERPSAP